MDFIPDEYQCEVTMMIKQCQSSSIESAPAAIESAPLPSQPSFDADYAETRRRQRATRLPRPLSPAFSSPPVTRSRRHQGESGEEESSAIPSDVTRFFEQARRDISSDEIYQQFIKLLDAYNREILPLSELFSAVTDLLHIRHPVVSHLRSFLAQKGIREDEVGREGARRLVDEPSFAAAVLGADPRLQGTHALLSRAPAADSAARGVAAIVRGQPGAERQSGVADDGLGGPVVHRGAGNRG